MVSIFGSLKRRIAKQLKMTAMCLKAIFEAALCVLDVHGDGKSGGHDVKKPLPFPISQRSVDSSVETT
jgi:hypothetical protein